MSQLAGLNIFDIVVIALILLLSIRGLLEGFTKELFSAIGLIGGVFVASYFHKSVAEYVSNNFLNSVSIKLLNIISLIVIFIVFFYLVKLISKGVQLIGKDETLSATSRLGGMLVKMLKLFFIFSLIVYAFSTKPQVTEKFKETLANSKIFPLLKNTGAAILDMPIISNVSTNSSESKTDTTAKESTDNNISNKTTITVDNNKSNEEETNRTNLEESNKTVKTQKEDNSTIEIKTASNNETNITKAVESTEENNSSLNEKNITNSEENSTNIETNLTK